MIAGNDCVFALKIGETYEAVYCATSFSFNQITNEIESTVNSDGRFRDFTYNTFSYTLSLDGMAKLGTVNSSFDVLIAQGGFVTLPYRLIFEEDSSVRTIEGECIVVTSAFTGQADQGLEFSHTFQGKGAFQSFVDGEPNDGGEIPEDGGDGGGGPGTGGEDSTCDVIINDDILDIIIAPNAPLSYNYRVQLNDIVGTWSYIAWRLDGGPWHYETSQEFLLPLLDNGSYTLELAPVCPNGVFGESVIKTFDVFNEEPAACDGTIDGWSYTSSANDDGTFTITFTVEASSPSETLNNIQYKLDGGYDAGIWMTRPLTDGVATFSAVLPSLDFNIDLRTVCSNGGFGFSVEDGGEIPEPSTCSTSIAILGYYLTYSFDTYSASAVINYTLSDPIEDILEIQWLSTITGEWVKVADAAEPIIVIPVVPGTLTNQQFRVVCSSSYFGPVSTILISVPIKQAQLDSRIINYTDTNATYHVIINGTTDISQGSVAANNITEFNYYGILNVPVTVRLTLDTPIDADACVLITNNTTYTGVVDGGDPNSIDFSVTVTYGIVIAFWAVEVVEECTTVVDFNGYGMTHDDTTGDWIITPIYTVTDNVTPTAVVEYWDGTTWIELGDADSFVPFHFSLPDNTTTTVRLRAKCGEGSFGPESAPIEIITPEFSTWEPENNATVINYSYEDQEVTILQAGVLIFTATLPARSSTQFNIAAWDSGDEIKITTTPGYPLIASDVPDPTVTWTTAIYEGDTIKGSYSHDPLDDHSILVNGAGVDLAHGVVFTIQTTSASPDFTVDSVDYSFDPDTGEFVGTPVVTGSDYYQYSTDGGLTWSGLFSEGDSFGVSGASEDDEIWVRSITLDEASWSTPFIITVEATICSASTIMVGYFPYYFDGAGKWNAYAYLDTEGTVTDVQQYFEGAWVGGYLTDPIIRTGLAGVNNTTEDVLFRVQCTSGLFNTAAPAPITWPDIASYTPSGRLLYYGGAGVLDYEVLANAATTTGTFSDVGATTFDCDLTTGVTITLTLPDEFPDVNKVVFTVDNQHLTGTDLEIVPGDSHSIRNVSPIDTTYGVIVAFYL